MSRSLAFVGILTIVGVAGTWSAIGQDNTGQTSQGVIVKNHMSDAERDRLMQEAMDQARRELEQEKAQQQAEQESQADAEKRKAEAAAARERAAAAAEEEKRRASDAAVKQKAKEEQLAAELAEAEKQSSVKKAADAEQKAGEAYDLDTLQPLKSSKAPVKQASKPASEPKESSAEARKPSTASEKKTPEVAKSKAKPSEEQQAEPEKTVIQTVSTKQPGSGLSVKTNMPVGDGERKAEQQRAAAGYADSSTGSRNSRDANVSGVVVGLLRSSAGPPRILVNTEDRRMVQVVIEKSGADIPAAGAQVSISGREIGGADGRPVISASSVSIKSGQAMMQPEVQTPQLAAAPVPVPPLPRVMGPPPHIMGHMPPPPMPMLPGGPGMMLPPPPPF